MAYALRGTPLYTFPTKESKKKKKMNPQYFHEISFCFRWMNTDEYVWIKI